MNQFKKKINQVEKWAKGIWIVISWGRKLIANKYNKKVFSFNNNQEMQVKTVMRK